VRKHFKYGWYIVRHKWFVFLAACELGIPWLGVMHDWSKLLPSEWMPYADHFYGQRKGRQRDATGYYKPTDTGDDSFDFAWLLHQKRNRHHWQWWILPEDNGGTKALAMPDKYRREMLADWRGAGRAQGYGDNTLEWWEKNNHKMQLHSETRAWIVNQLGAAQ